MRGYGLASLALIVIHPILPEAWGDSDLLLVCVGAVACVVYGRRTVRPGARRPWTLLLWALGVVAFGNLLPLLPTEGGIAASWLLDAAGNLLVLAAALDLIGRGGTGDLGGVVDAAVIALAAGSLLWILLPHRLGLDQSFSAQVDLFIVVFALTGVLGALLRLAHADAASTAPWWLLAAISLAIGGNIVLSISGGDRDLRDVSTMLFMAAFTATGLFGLDPTGPRLAYPQVLTRDRLSAGRLVFLCAAVAVIPVVVGIREMLAGDAAGLLLAVQGTLVAVLVMARVGLLAAQRAAAERALEHQATHDPLTHLPNRRQFVERLRDHLALGTACVLLFCDLDDFKSINDRFGHETGDELLVEVAHRLRACAGPPHVVSRFGGDEFVVLLIESTPDEIESIRACINTELRRPFERAYGSVVGVSVGVAQADGERDPEQLIKNADRAMYRVKHSRTGPPSPVARPSRSPAG
jgi:diguanylate cyclase (GGDEF)-like protein